MKKREPHLVLGIDKDASAAAVKAAWRRLARANHPDLNASDPAAARAATARMVEINAAYERLRDGGPADGQHRNRAHGEAHDGPTSASGAAGGRRAGPPPPRPTRPVTAHLDTTEMLYTSNRTTSPGGSAGCHGSLGQPARRSRASNLGPRRASTPTGPLRRGRVRNFRAPVLPDLETALATEMPFGKFHGHTLGQIAGFEPSYIDWVSGTITRDPELVAAARVVRLELDRRGIVRRTRESHVLRPATD
ncbi:MAG: DnaJ domain-containing protein [Candidatus Limnocylindrales bacterium]